MPKITDQTPDYKIVEAIDSFFQNEDLHPRFVISKWEGKMNNFYPENSEGWEDVKQKHPNLFKAAFYTANAFLYERGFTLDDVNNHFGY